MEIINLDNYAKVYVIGDIHGDFTKLSRMITSNSATKEDEENHYQMVHASLTSMGVKKKRIRPLNNKFNDSIIIIAGDCGFGFNQETYYSDILSNMNEKLKNTNTHVIFIRGNHDDPSYFNGKINLSNIKAVKDYTVIQTENENILCVGGAISVDRSWRMSKEEYINRFAKSHKKTLFWKDEAPYFDKETLEEIEESGIDINFVITHAAPSFISLNHENDIKSWEENDPKLRQDIENERHTIDNIYNFLIDKNMSLRGWYFGHYHTYHKSHSDQFIPFVGLDCNFSSSNIYECMEDNEDKLALPKMNWSLYNGGAGIPDPHREPIHERLRRQLEGAGRPQRIEPLRYDRFVVEEPMNLGETEPVGVTAEESDDIGPF